MEGEPVIRGKLALEDSCSCEILLGCNRLEELKPEIEELEADVVKLSTFLAVEGDRAAICIGGSPRDLGVGSGS